MDSRTREDIAAATAVHRELGPGYDDAVAESLVERIGAEVDKRVDARLAQRNAPPPVPVTPVPPARSQWAPVTLAIGSMLVGVAATAAALLSKAAHDNGPVFATVVIWIVIAIINIVYARRR